MTFRGQTGWEYTGERRARATKARDGSDLPGSAGPRKEPRLLCVRPATGDDNEEGKAASTTWPFLPTPRSRIEAYLYRNVSLSL